MEALSLSKDRFEAFFSHPISSKLLVGYGGLVGWYGCKFEEAGCKNTKERGIFQIADKRSMPSRAVTRNVVEKLKSVSKTVGSGYGGGHEEVKLGLVCRKGAEASVRNNCFVCKSRQRRLQRCPTRKQKAGKDWTKRLNAN